MPLKIPDNLEQALAGADRRGYCIAEAAIVAAGAVSSCGYSIADLCEMIVDRRVEKFTPHWFCSYDTCSRNVLIYGTPEKAYLTLYVGPNRPHASWRSVADALNTAGFTPDEAEKV